MSVITAYLSKLGRDYKISPHFSLWEMQCKDGADKVLYSTALFEKLEELGAFLGWEAQDIHIDLISGYRTASHNAKPSVGGAKYSQHLYGTAADIRVRKGKSDFFDAKLICCICQDLGFAGVAIINNTNVHVDMRASGTYRGDERKNYGNNIKNNNFYDEFGITRAQVEALRYVAPEEDPIEEEEEIMTQEKFDQMMNNWIARQAAKEPSAWSAEAREWAEGNGIIVGTGAGFSYESYCTREQMVQFLYRLFQRLSK